MLKLGSTLTNKKTSVGCLSSLDHKIKQLYYEYESEASNTLSVARRTYNNYFLDRENQLSRTPLPYVVLEIPWIYDLKFVNNA